MKLTDLQDDKLVGNWMHHHTDLCEAQGCRHIPSKLNEVMFPMIEFRQQLLDEASYRELAGLIDGNFLNQNVRAEELKTIRYAGFDGDTMIFNVNSREFEDNSIVYKCLIQFVDWDQIGQDNDLDNNEKARMLLWVGNIKLWCADPSFQYFGYNYLLSVLDAAIYPEVRKPVKKNPQERGSVCKHLNRVLRVLPFYLGDIAKELKRQFGE